MLVNNFDLKYIGRVSRKYGIYTLDCTSVDNYQSLTLDDFIFDLVAIVYKQAQSYTNPIQSCTNDVRDRCTYDSSNGILTLTHVGHGAYYTSVGTILDIYCK